MSIWGTILNHYIRCTIWYTHQLFLSYILSSRGRITWEEESIVLQYAYSTKQCKWVLRHYVRIPVIDFYYYLRTNRYEEMNDYQAIVIKLFGGIDRVKACVAIYMNISNNEKTVVFLQMIPQWVWLCVLQKYLNSLC